MVVYKSNLSLQMWNQGKENELYRCIKKKTSKEESESNKLNK